MESQSENDSLQARFREIEDENHELRAQNLVLNRTVIELRNELFLMRVQMSELTDTSSLLRERVRNLIQQHEQQSEENERNAGLLTAPPLMPPTNPPPPPPFPPAHITISPRQVGAGEALMTPLGVSISSPPRHRIKRESRQGFYRSVRNPYRRADIPEPGPSTANAFIAPERTNYFLGLRIVPQFETSFVCAPSVSSDSASDSSGSDDVPQTCKQTCSKTKQRGEDLPFRKSSLPRGYDIFKNVRNYHHAKVRPPILTNYNLSLPNTNSKFILPLPWSGKSRETLTLPSTSGHHRASHSGRIGQSDSPLKKISNCVQYTFPAIHEGLHHNRIPSPILAQPSRPRKFKKNILYIPPDGASYSNVRRVTDPADKLSVERGPDSLRVESESLSSTEEPRSRPSAPMEDPTSDFEQDGFQADESSNCMTSTDNSLEEISVTDAGVEKKK